MVELILIRGLPGSGKSTIAKTYKGYKHYEADMYHMVDGVYQYDKENAGLAHNWCQNKTHEALRNYHNVVVSNTFTRYWEMVPYFEIANYLDVKVAVIEAKGCYDTIHGVPDEVIGQMIRRWETYK